MTEQPGTPRTALDAFVEDWLAPETADEDESWRERLAPVIQEAAAAGRARRDAELLKHGQINVGTVVGYEAGLAEGRREAAATAAAQLAAAQEALREALDTEWVNGNLTGGALARLERLLSGDAPARPQQEDAAASRLPAAPDAEAARRDVRPELVVWFHESEESCSHEEEPLACEIMADHFLRAFNVEPRITEHADGTISFEAQHFHRLAVVHNDALATALVEALPARPTQQDAALRCSAIWNGCVCGRPPHADERHVWLNTLDGQRAVDPALYPAQKDAALDPALLARLLDGIRDEVREAVQDGDAQDCSSPDCIADAVYTIVRSRLRAAAPETREGGR